jgi:hypothetical protein
MAMIAVMIFAAPFAWAEGELCVPTDKTAGTAYYKVVSFDDVVYRVISDIPCELSFIKVDETHHYLSIKPSSIWGTVTPYCEVSVQWGSFPALTLGLEMGGVNGWFLGTETGYAEK